jgi:hypothetical protein
MVLYNWWGCLNLHQKKLKILVTTVIVIFLVIPVILPIISHSILNTANAESTLTQSTADDFRNGTLQNLTIQGTGENAELSLSKGEWIKKYPKLSPRPSTRYDHEMASISTDEKVLLFGGWSGSRYLNDTWIYDMDITEWYKMMPPNRPRARNHLAMASINGTDKVLLFGGKNGTQSFNDTWIYDLSEDNWTNMKPIIHPNATDRHAMSTIYGTDKVLLFGGSSYSTETWVYDLSENNWTIKYPVMQFYPSGRHSHDMAMVSGTDEIILFGGKKGSTLLRDVWIYDLSANYWDDVTPFPSPSGEPERRYGHTMANINGTKNVIIFGGYYLKSYVWGSQIEPIRDTWIFYYNNNSWRKISPDEKWIYLEKHAMATAKGTDKIVMFAKYQTRVFDLSKKAWELHYYSSPYPQGNEFGSALIDGTDKVLLFGQGTFAYGKSITDDTWIYDLSDNTWVRRFPEISPIGRAYYAMATIWGTDKVLLYGGVYWKGLSSPWYDSCGDTWIYDYSDNIWTNVSTKSRYYDYYNAADVFGTDKIVIWEFGSTSYIPNSNPLKVKDYGYTFIYENNKNKWVAKRNYPAPIRCQENYAMAPVHGTDKIVLFGGYDFSSNDYNNETWIYDFSDNTWTKKSPITKPSPRAKHTMAAINGTDKILLFGGYYYKSKSYHYSDTWIYDLSDDNWTKQDLSIQPNAMTAPTITAVNGTDKIVLINNPIWIYDYSKFFSNGSFISACFNVGSNASFKQLNWNINNSGNTSSKFQIRTANNESNLLSKDFIGPDGTNTSYYTILGASIWHGHTGDRWLQYKVYFNNYNENTTSKLISITIRYNCLPNTKLNNPTNEGKISNNKPAFKWNFSDLDSSSQIAFQLLISNDSSFKNISYDSGQQSSTNQSWQFPNGTNYTTLFDGKWYWKVRSKDSDNDWGQYSPSRMFIIDTIPPISFINYPKNVYYNSVNNINGIASDTNGSGINKVEINIKCLANNKYWSGSQWTSTETWLLATGTNSWIYDSSSITWTSGERYTIRSRAIDNATNIEIPGSGIIFNIDFGKPLSTIDFPFDNSYLNVLNTISGNAFDVDGSGLNNVEISIKEHKTNKYWNSIGWSKSEYWLPASGTYAWSYDSSIVPWMTDISYSIHSRAMDNLNNIEIPSSETIFMFDDEPPLGLSIYINNNDDYTNSSSVKLSINAEDSGSGVSHMCFSIDGDDWTSWIPFNATPQLLNLPEGDGKKLVFLQVRDKANNTAIANDSIILDTTAPESLSIIINNGDQFTNSRDLELELNAKDSLSGVNIITLSDDNNTWISWEPFTRTRLFSISPTNGEKTIYFKVRDQAGNIAESVFNTIILDTTPPKDISIVINDGKEFTNTENVILKLTGQDTFSGVDRMSFGFDNETWTEWETFKDNITLNIPSGDGEKTIYFRFKDRAGNKAESVFDKIILDSKPPESVNIKINNNAGYTNTIFVDLQISAFDSLSGLDKMSLSLNEVEWTNWEGYKNESLIELPKGDGYKIVYLRVIDKAGNLAWTNDTIILDTSPPHSLSILINNGAKETNDTTLNLTLNALDNLSGVDKMSFSQDNKIWSSWEYFSYKSTFNLSSENGEKVIYFKVKDNANVINCNSFCYISHNVS